MRRRCPVFRVIPAAPPPSLALRVSISSCPSPSRPSARRSVPGSPACLERSAFRICNFRSFRDLHSSRSLPAFRVAAGLGVLHDQRRAGSGAGAGGNSLGARRNDRARHAASRRSDESVQRDHGRQAESGGRERPAARVRAARAVERRLRDRSGDVHGRRQVQGRPQPAARRAVVGPAHAVGGEQRREHDQGQPDAGRSQNRQTRQADPRRRSVQHVLLARRQVRDHRGRGAEATRLSRPGDDEAAVLARRPAVRRHQPRRLLDRRQVRDLHVRIRRHRGQDRPREPQGAGIHAGDPARPPDQDRQGTRRRSTRRSARPGRACRRTSAPHRMASSSTSPT